MILHYFKKNENKDKEIALTIFSEIINSSKSIILSINQNNKNKFDNSFEIVSILIFCMFYASKLIKKSQLKSVNQEIMNIFIQDLDISLRELGIGDMAIGKHVKHYTKKFYYRISVLENIFELNDLKMFKDYLDKYSIVYIEKNHKNPSIFFEKLNSLIDRVKNNDEYLGNYSGLFN